MFQYKAKVLKVVDGDTLDIQIDLGFQVFTIQRIRLRGIDTPETFRRKKYSEEYRKGLAAKEFVIRFLHNTNYDVIVHTGKERGKYGRYIADVFSSPGDVSLCKSLVSAGHAVLVEY